MRRVKFCLGIANHVKVFAIHLRSPAQVPMQGLAQGRRSQHQNNVTTLENNHNFFFTLSHLSVSDSSVSSLVARNCLGFSVSRAFGIGSAGSLWVRDKAPVLLEVVLSMGFRFLLHLRRYNTSC